jgi:hypothetical protein
VNHDLEKGKTYLHAEALLEGSIIALKENKKKIKIQILIKKRLLYQKLEWMV